jgi:hypothetical protein
MYWNEKNACFDIAGNDKSKGTRNDVLVKIKHGFFLYAGYLATFGTMNFFVGSGIGGLEIGLRYAGFFLSTGCLMLFVAIPGFGMAVAVYFWPACEQMMLLLGVVHNFWIDTMIAVPLIAGVVLQTMFLTWIVMKVLFHVKTGKPVACIERP